MSQLDVNLQITKASKPPQTSAPLQHFHFHSSPLNPHVPSHTIIVKKIKNKFKKKDQTGIQWN